MCKNPGTVPQITFQYVTDNFVYKLTRRPFSLTATVESNLNLTSLYWSPEYKLDEHDPTSLHWPVPSPSKTITVHHGNITTTTFMLLKNATLGDNGHYTLTAVNECGRNFSQIHVKVVTGKVDL